MAEPEVVVEEDEDCTGELASVEGLESEVVW